MLEHVLIWLIFVVIWVLNAQKRISKTMVHVELLEKTDHVTNASQIFDANIACWAFIFIKVHDNPIILLVTSPAWIFVEFMNEVQHKVQIWQTISAENGHKFESSASCDLLIQFWLSCHFDFLFDLVRVLEQIFTKKAFKQSLSNLFLFDWEFLKNNFK